MSLRPTCSSNSVGLILPLLLPPIVSPSSSVALERLRLDGTEASLRTWSAETTHERSSCRIRFAASSSESDSEDDIRLPHPQLSQTREVYVESHHCLFYFSAFFRRERPPDGTWRGGERRWGAERCGGRA